MIRFNEFFVDIGFDIIKAVLGRVFANTLQKPRGDALSLHIRCDHKAKYGFYPDVWAVFLNRPKRAQIIDAEPAVRAGVAPSHDFAAVICKITLQAAVPDKLESPRPPFLPRRIPVVPVFIGIVAAPGHALAFALVNIDVVRRYIKKMHIFLRKVGRQLSDFDFHALPP